MALRGPPRGQRERRLRSAQLMHDQRPSASGRHRHHARDEHERSGPQACPPPHTPMNDPTPPRHAHPAKLLSDYSIPTAASSTSASTQRLHTGTSATPGPDPLTTRPPTRLATQRLGHEARARGPKTHGKPREPPASALSLALRSACKSTPSCGSSLMPENRGCPRFEPGSRDRTKSGPGAGRQRPG
jgi:hypothetical protein